MAERGIAPLSLGNIPERNEDDTRPNKRRRVAHGLSSGCDCNDTWTLIATGNSILAVQPCILYFMLVQLVAHQLNSQSYRRMHQARV